MTTNTKIVLDADVIIHFVKAGQFSLLLDIFPAYQYLILDVVYDEVTVNRLSKTQIDNTLKFFASRIVNVKFEPKGESRFEYARLRSTLLLGKGESACMVYCRDSWNPWCDASTSRGYTPIDTIIENSLTALG